MALLISGSKGFLGSRIVDYLRNNSLRYTCLSRSSSYDTEFLFPSGFNYLSERNTLLHLAAPNAKQCLNSPIDSLSYSSLSVASLLSQCQRYNISRFVLFSSVHAHNFIPNDTSSSDPLYFYKLSKTLLETALLKNSYSLNSVVLRIPNIVGCTFNTQTDPLVPYLIAEQLMKSGIITLRDSLNTQRPFLPFNHLLKDLLNLVFSDTLLPYTTMNISPPYDTSLGHLVNVCKSALTQFNSCYNPSFYKYDAKASFEEELYREFFNIILCLSKKKKS